MRGPRQIEHVWQRRDTAFCGRWALFHKQQRSHAMKRLIAGTGIALLLSPVIAFAGENPILGTWKLKSFVREVFATGEKLNQYGEHPDGYLSYSPDGRMYAIGAWEKRVKPRNADPQDEERIKLHQSMFAYAGTYTLESGKVVHHLDISWNEAWTGTDQVRFYKLDGDTLTITTAPNKSPYDGREGRSILIWEKVKAAASE